eukprot:6176923-Pleurochrysis_carterae.AAC.1
MAPSRRNGDAAFPALEHRDCSSSNVDRQSQESPSRPQPTADALRMRRYRQMRKEKEESVMRAQLALKHARQLSQPQQQPRTEAVR